MINMTTGTTRWELDFSLPFEDVQTCLQMITTQIIYEYGA